MQGRPRTKIPAREPQHTTLHDIAPHNHTTVGLRSHPQNVLDTSTSASWHGGTRIEDHVPHTRQQPERQAPVPCRRIEDHVPHTRATRTPNARAVQTARHRHVQTARHRHVHCPAANRTEARRSPHPHTCPTPTPASWHNQPTASCIPNASLSRERSICFWGCIERPPPRKRSSVPNASLSSLGTLLLFLGGHRAPPPKKEPLALRWGERESLSHITTC